MDCPDIDDAVVEKLDALGFAGLDASTYVNLFEYGGVWSEEFEVAMLLPPDVKDPGVCFLHIAKDDIHKEVVQAGPGFASFVDAEHCGEPEGMAAIQSLMLYNGGWHADSHAWTPLSQWDDGELLRVLTRLCEPVPVK